MATRIGKFEVRRVLGRGAQSCVYLAHDPDLQREVAIKRLKGPDAGLPSQPLTQVEARAVSRLRHPNIVSIFEWGQQDGQAYLVFEYVAGRTLQQLLAQEGRLPPVRAVSMMIGVLEALEHAHAAGVIHRDLKPSNILIDEDGRPRVMDFGIASHAGVPVGGDLMGTAAYMAPEYIARGDVTPRYDVFSSGLVLYEAVFGRRAVEGETAFQAMHQIANMPLAFPEGSPSAADGRLHDMIAKATAKDPQQRYGTAREMREALQAWLQPPVSGASAEGGRPSTLDFLLRRLRLNPDFPAMSSAIQAIQRLTGSDRTHVGNLSNFILKDFALTNKILRLVNSATYPNRSGDRIRTVSRAIVMLGFDTVRSIAISLMLFEHLQDKKHAQSLREEYLRANLGGLLARAFGARLLPTQSEETFICALFHDLGRLLTLYYLRDEAEAIGRLVQSERCTEEGAALRVLGIGYEALGIGVARNWGFPDTIVNAMRGLPDGRCSRPASPDEQLRLISVLASEVRAVLESSIGPGRAAALAQVVRRFADSVPLTEKDMAEAIRTASDGIAELAGTLGMDWRKTRLAEALGAANLAESPDDALEAPGMPDGPLIEPFVVGATAGAEACLASGIQEVSQALVDELPVGDVLRIITETIYRALCARRVFLCLRDDGLARIRARFGFGVDAEEMLSRFEIGLGGTDLFNRILSKDAGVLIRDAGETRVRAHLPGWFLERFDAPTFLIFPLKARGAPVGLIYVDHHRAGGLVVTEGTLSQLNTLRNQTVLLVRQKR